MLRHDFVADLERIAPHIGTTLHWPRESDVLSHDGLADLGKALDEALVLVQRQARKLLDAHLLDVPDSPLLGRISLFRAIGMIRQETIHTGTLSWLIDPRQPHGFESALCQAFVRAINVSGEQDPASSLKSLILDPSSRVTNVASEFWLSSDCRMDVLIEGHAKNGTRWAVVVEAKVDAEEQKDQLLNYDRALERRARQGWSDVQVLRVFLSEDGRSGKSSALGSAWARMSYLDIAREFLATYRGLGQSEGHAFLRIYLSGLLEELCGISCGADLIDLLAKNNAVDIERLLTERK
ncbi:PDDEXK-like family protein [Pseudoxanthomonas japonensis]|uniref:PD-(D/E)XK nuclease superfamily protein n=1 Tax=Pseudoxanthomonas japonensis TaxID=69284 RepID=A0ABQ6ZHT0_9GAMM|nr:PD-(D/E)XK nuclease family protein [Pseudoxanthomonas japonensis]KAF1725494.1 hypothetical protein CSC78_08495 [Pseudoxanthomonas japonensis]